MERESSSLETQTPIFVKKKAKHSKHKDRHRRHSQESFRAAPLANEQCDITKSKKKRKASQRLVSSPLKISEICDETEMATSKPKKKKKRSIGSTDCIQTYYWERSFRYRERYLKCKPEPAQLLALI